MSKKELLWKQEWVLPKTLPTAATPKFVHSIQKYFQFADCRTFAEKKAEINFALNILALLFLQNVKETKTYNPKKVIEKSLTWFDFI